MRRFMLILWMQLPVQVLFVCETMFRRLAADAGLTAQFACDSAGIINYYAGERADPRTRKVAAASQRGR